MTGSILDRLSARIAAAPALPGINTLFSDLKEAHDEILELRAKLGDDLDKASTVTPHISSSIVAHVHQLLLDARERMSVNAIGTVSSHIESAIKLLEG